MTAKKWQVYVRDNGGSHKYGDPLPQDKAMKVVEDLQKDKSISDAWLEEK